MERNSGSESAFDSFNEHEEIPNQESIDAGLSVVKPSGTELQSSGISEDGKEDMLQLNGELFDKSSKLDPNDE
jgi:hypothetical protein